jgi:hypothetical protein
MGKFKRLNVVEESYNYLRETPRFKIIRYLQSGIKNTNNRVLWNDIFLFYFVYYFYKNQTNAKNSVYFSECFLLSKNRICKWNSWKSLLKAQNKDKFILVLFKFIKLLNWFQQPGFYYLKCNNNNIIWKITTLSQHCV